MFLKAEAIGYGWNGKQTPGERRMKSIPVNTAP
jgi:hypothetical protein